MEMHGDVGRYKGDHQRRSMERSVAERAIPSASAATAAGPRWLLRRSRLLRARVSVRVRVQVRVRVAMRVRVGVQAG